MILYDCTFILTPHLDESGYDNYIKQTRELIGRYEGSVVAENRIGQRRMAYEIRKMTQGYYISLVFEGTGETVRELERHLRLDENCLRYMTCQAQVPSGRSETAARPAAAAVQPAVKERAESFESEEEEGLPS